jgi:GH25 family lysozyme M1 (1,4-beta-N-acetylmuramidase)
VGIDVSSHQGNVDWQSVRQSGVDFVILRVGYRGYTDGGIFADATFTENLQAAKSAGLKIGVYFFSQAITVQEAEEEAAFVLDALHGVSLDLPVYFDWEFVEETAARTNEASSETLTDCAIAFCEAVEKAGYKAGVYFNQSLGYLMMNLGRLKEYDFWLAEYHVNPEFYYHFHMWQYTDHGDVSGVTGNVDLNIRF